MYRLKKVSVPIMAIWLLQGCGDEEASQEQAGFNDAADEKVAHTLTPEQRVDTTPAVVVFSDTAGM